MFLCIFLCICGAPDRSFAANSADVQGEWRQMEFASFSMAAARFAPSKPPADTPPCNYISFTERTLTLFPLPGHPTELRGWWRRHTTLFWTPSYTQECRWFNVNEPQFRMSVEANVMFAVDARLDTDTGEITVDTTFNNCDGLICSLAVPQAVVENPASTVFKVRFTGNQLIDDLDGKQKLFFVRTGFAAERQASAEDTISSVVELFDKRNQSELTAKFGTKRLQAANAYLTTLMQQLPRVSQRFRQSALYGTAMNSVTGAQGEYLLILNRVISERGLVGIELMVMFWEDGRWQIDWLMVS